MKLSAQERYKLIKSVIDHETSVTKACLELNLSRKTFYKWLNRYNKNYHLGAAALEDRQWIIENHPKKISSDIESNILKIAAEQPTHSSHKIAEILGIGNHGVQNVLKRNNLNLYESRMIYAKELESAQNEKVQAPDNYLPYNTNDNYVPTHSPAPPSNWVGLFFINFLVPGTISFLFFFFIFANQNHIFFIHPSIYNLGLLFAMISLLFGLVLFLYSLKYYLSVSIVLSQSRADYSGIANSSGLYKSKWNRLTSLIFGLEIEIQKEPD